MINYEVILLELLLLVELGSRHRRCCKRKLALVTSLFSLQYIVAQRTARKMYGPKILYSSNTQQLHNQLLIQMKE
jgi:hypothetical protein